MNEDDLGVAMASVIAEESAAEVEDPIAALFLSAEDSLEAIEREARAADSLAETEADDVLAIL